MAIKLPPAPIDQPPTSYAWTDWYFKLRELLIASGTVLWSNINFTGSNHENIQLIQGGTPAEHYHMSAVQYQHIGQLQLFSGAADPTTTDIDAGYSKLWLNTSTGTVKLWVNNAGTLKSVTLT
jgi:hypothetical protein